MRTSDLRQLILKMFGTREFYGYDVRRVLSSEGVEIEISRIYRVLNAMLKEELLESRWTTSRVGPRKRMYKLSEKGREVLNEIFLDAIRTVHSFYGLYLLKLIPKINVFKTIYQLLTHEMQGDEIIVFITQDFTPMHEMIIQTLHRNLPHGKIFLVKPGALEIVLNLANLFLLDGFYDDIPLKTNYVDCMIMVDLPKQEYLDQALKEWRRVLTNTGRLAILTPTVLLEKYDDPLTIGDFIEKYEHETIEKGEHIDKEDLEEQIKQYFADIEEHTLVHMTILQVSKPIPFE